ncbi:GNAT family N-acetyltransferase [Deinococcus aquiradiocola]|uniref:GNAT family N-acetyltransferase n=1 Tax=Deinococcus aquiradiocola TaxID=393059 RepID=UPI00166AB681|nr:GNAT family N-acetyltransferase [Deinococcus aquiradiocola]
MSSFRIRAAIPADLPSLVTLFNVASPDHPTSLELQQHRERHRRPDLHFRRVVAVQDGPWGQEDGGILGVATSAAQEWSGDVGRLVVAVTVHPERRGQGIARALYDDLIGGLPGGTRHLMSVVREDRTDALTFAARRGFQEVAREQDVALDLKDLRNDGRDEAFRRAAAGGYVLGTFAQHAARVGADRAWEDLYALDLDASRDVPLAPGDSLNHPPLARYRETQEGRPDFDPDLVFVAERDGTLAALSELHPSPTPDRMGTGFTGVGREHRGHRLAWALKYLALEEAARRGVARVTTTNASDNLPMRRINEGLGFRPLPAHLTLHATLP